ncbi:hypothetical protein FOZ63_007936 [Perkinsus olseni]|uniref:Beta-1,4-mannosyl-glycoprotein 4-beta-N-acetylglucosaminyltransferase n=1 Tax=Perkinsus olseni TaxID=32597 RepID=A0A7J6QZ13_PEROL|nr:hypothetical protein FOZ63_007936 [Perkinsus olseni]
MPNAKYLLNILLIATLSALMYFWLYHQVIDHRTADLLLLKETVAELASRLDALDSNSTALAVERQADPTFRRHSPASTYDSANATWVRTFVEERLGNFWVRKRPEIQAVVRRSIEEMTDKVVNTAVEKIRSAGDEEIMFRHHTRVIDAFLYNGEQRMWQLRRQLLGHLVDHFILVEGECTFQGARKKQLYSEKLPHDDKLTRHTVSCEEASRPHPHEVNRLEMGEAWRNEAVVRNAALLAIDSVVNNMTLGEEDLIAVILSDVDEVPDPVKLTNVLRLEQKRLRRGEVFAFEADFYYYTVLCKHENSPWMLGPRLASLETVRRVSPDGIRLDGVFENQNASGEQSSVLLRPCECFKIQSVLRGGWHFSYFMSVADIRRKLASFSHAEYSTAASGLSDEDLTRRIQSCDSILGNGDKLKKLESPEVNSLPKPIAERLDDWTSPPTS